MNKNIKTTWIILAGIVGVLVCWVIIRTFVAADNGSLFTPVNEGSSTTTQMFAHEALSETYSNSAYGFSLNYFPGMNANEFADSQSGGDVVLISVPGTNIGLQILITPWKGSSDALTLADLQGMTGLAVENPQSVTVGSGTEAGKGLAFLDSTGPSANRQVWFVSSGHLYQITSPVVFDSELKKILGTWHFAVQTATQTQTQTQTQK